MDLPAKYYEKTEDNTHEGLMGNYGHGNEPSQHIPYLYMWTSQPWKTQYRLREIMDRMYRNNIDGLCGNDDCGQMSAWYIFSAWASIRFVRDQTNMFLEHLILRNGNTS